MEKYTLNPLRKGFWNEAHNKMELENVCNMTSSSKMDICSHDEGQGKEGKAHIDIFYSRKWQAVVKKSKNRK